MSDRQMNWSNYKDLLLALTIKEIKARHKKTALGFFWVLLSPLLQMVIIGIVFSFFTKVENYFIFLLTGLIPWLFFSQAINRATSSIVAERRLLQKTKFPVEIIPVSIVLSELIYLLSSLALLILYLLIFQSDLLVKLYLIIPGLFWLTLLTLGISLITSSLFTKYRDVSYIVKTIITLGFYATPIIYSIKSIPGDIKYIFMINPAVSIIEMFHEGFLLNGYLNNQFIFVNLLVSIFLIILGGVIFSKMRKYFVDWL